MVSRARMRSWFATTEFFVVIAIFLLVAGLLANGQSDNSRTSKTAADQPAESVPTVVPQPADAERQELLPDFERPRVGESDLVANPFAPTLLAVDLTESVTPSDPSSGEGSSSKQESRPVPEPTVFGLLGSLAALYLLVNRMRSLCG